MPASKSAGVGILIVQCGNESESSALGDAVADDLKPPGRKIFRDQPWARMQKYTSVSDTCQVFQQLREPFLPMTGLVFVVQDK